MAHKDVKILVGDRVLAINGVYITTAHDNSKGSTYSLMC